VGNSKIVLGLAVALLAFTGFGVMSARGEEFTPNFDRCLGVRMRLPLGNSSTDPRYKTDLQKAAICDEWVSLNSPAGMTRTINSGGRTIRATRGWWR
jgi:hypothetical protein